MATATKQRMPIEELREQKCYRDLTERQRKMVETFITSGDRVLAVLTAYNAKTPEVVRVLSYEFFQNPKVIACLTVYFQDDPFDVFKDEVLRAFRNRKLTVAQVQALKIFCDLNGYGSGSLPKLNGYEPGSRKKFDIGDIVTLDGKRLRVTAINAEGRPIEGDPLE